MGEVIDKGEKLQVEIDIPCIWLQRIQVTLEKRRWAMQIVLGYFDRPKPFRAWTPVEIVDGEDARSMTEQEVLDELKSVFEDDKGYGEGLMDMTRSAIQLLGLTLGRMPTPSQLENS